MEKRASLTHGSGFWIVAAAFLISMAYCTVPTPLYLIYQHQDGFPTSVITIVFAAYAIGVIASLYFAGHVSDWLGRRPIIIGALAAEFLSAVLFLFWQGVGMLIAARVLSGIGIGALTSTATAHLSELRAVARPAENREKAALVATIVNTGGLALGPPIAGLLSQYLPAPVITPYALFLVLLLAAGIAVLFVPETVEPPHPVPAYRPQRLSVAGGNTALVVAAGVGVLAAFAVTGMFGSLTPTLLAGTMHENSRFIAGVVAGSVFASGTVAQVAFARTPRRARLLVGVLAMACGLPLIVAAMTAGSLAIFLTASICAGTGVGLILRTSIAVASEVAGSDNRGAVIAAVFLMGYIGLAVPVIGLGLLMAPLSGRTALLLFASLVLLLVLWSGARMLRSLRPARTESPT